MRAGRESERVRGERGERGGRETTGYEPFRENLCLEVGVWGSAVEAGE